MSRSVVVRLFLVGFLITALFTGCSRDPNVRKQKFWRVATAILTKASTAKRNPVCQCAAGRLAFRPGSLQAGRNLSQARRRPPRRSGTLARRRPCSGQLSRPYRPGQSLGRGSRNPDGSVNDEYLKQARVELDLLREKQPQNPSVFQAWADYYAAQNKLGERRCRKCRKPLPPIPTAQNLT
jgi:hypothetical protein